MKILLVDPDTERCKALQANLDFMEYEAEVVDGDRLLTRAAEGDADVVMMGPCTERDESMVTLFRALREQDPHLPVIRLASEDEPPPPADVDSGSMARVSMPPRFGEVQAALQQASAYRDSRHLSGRPRSLELFRNLVGGSAAIRGVRKLIEQVAGTDASVLLLGESGTGKEVAARLLHWASERRTGP